VGFQTPERAALAGDKIDAETSVLAYAISTSNAALLLMSLRWHHPDLVLCYRDETGWVEGSSTSGRTIWSQTEDDREVGVLISWGRARSGESALRVTFHGETSTVPVTNGYYIWTVEGVARADIDDPAEFQSVP
jgi:hypothetical protein